MKKLTLVYRMGDRERRKEFQGKDVSYKEGDPVLGQDYVQILADGETFTMAKNLVVSIHVAKG